MNNLEFDKTIEFIFQECINRVDTKRKELKKPQIDLCRSDKSLVSHFFNFNCSSVTHNNNNKYLVTKRLLDSVDESGKKTGAVNAFAFKDVHEVLWGNEEEFNNNLFTIFSLLVTDIINSNHSEKKLLLHTLCDNIIFAKYYSFYIIKKTFNISLLEYCAVCDDAVNASNMNKYTNIAISHLYNKPHFTEKFKAIFLDFTKKHEDYTHIDNRLNKEFLPEFLLLLKEYKPHENSLGLRVKKLIEIDMIKSIAQLDSYKNNSDFLLTPEYEINKKIINATSQYLARLEDIATACISSGVYTYGW